MIAPSEGNHPFVERYDQNHLGTSHDVLDRGEHVVYEYRSGGTLLLSRPIRLETVESDCQTLGDYHLDMLATFMAHGNLQGRHTELAARVIELDDARKKVRESTTPDRPSSLAAADVA